MRRKHQQLSSLVQSGAEIDSRDRVYVHYILSYMEVSSEKTTWSEDFSKLQVDELKNYLQKRGIQLSDGGEGKRRADLLDLCQKAAAMKQRNLDDSAEDRTKLLEDKLQTSEGKLSDPKTLSA